jgi:Fic family protein
MKNKNITKKVARLQRSISDLAELQLKTNALPPLSDVEKAKLDQSLAIDQLYYSSKIEGTKLTNSMIQHAIHGRKLSSS